MEFSCRTIGIGHKRAQTGNLDGPGNGENLPRMNTWLGFDPDRAGVAGAELVLDADGADAGGEVVR